MIELERTYLPKSLPNLEGCKSKEIIDIYLPTPARHPTLRIRKNGSRYEITKKEPVADDPSKQKEETTSITKEEFDELNQSVQGKRVHKIRYYYPYQNRTAEIDVFQGLLKGLVLVDFEFETEEDKDSFATPEFCMVDITRQEFIAGGMLCGKSYEDIEEELKKVGYERIG